jgi:tripartite-type tricarboxylate transporter receptor subunit TctC
VVARINRELAVIAKQPAFQDKLAKLGLAVDFKPGDEFIAFMNADTRKWRELIPAMGIPQVD